MCVSMQAEAIAQQEFMSKYPGKKPSTFAQRKISNKGVSCLCIIDEHVLVESNFCRASFITCLASSVEIQYCVLFHYHGWLFTLYWP